MDALQFLGQLERSLWAAEGAKTIAHRYAAAGVPLEMTPLNANSARLGMAKLLIDPFIKALPREFREVLESVPVGFLPLRIVNAACLLSPDGSPIVVVNLGLFNALVRWGEINEEAPLVNRAHGGEAHEAYLMDQDALLLRYFVDGDYNGYHLGGGGTLDERVHWFCVTRASSAELFAIAHEFAHIVSGHLDAAESTSVRAVSGAAEDVEVLIRSRANEIDADRLAWSWLKQYWNAVPQLEQCEAGHVLSGPLDLFNLIGLIDANRDAEEVATTHPAAAERLRHLASIVGEVPLPGRYRGTRGVEWLSEMYAESAGAVELLPRLSAGFRRRALARASARAESCDEAPLPRRVLNPDLSWPLQRLAEERLFDAAYDLYERARVRWTRDPKAAAKLYAEFVALYGDEPDTDLRELSGGALLAQAVYEHQAASYTRALDHCEEVLVRLATESRVRLRRVRARALFCKAKAAEGLGSTEVAATAYMQAVELAVDDDLDVRHNVATTMIVTGGTLLSAGELEEGLAMIGAVVEHFGSDDDPGIVSTVAFARSAPSL